MNREIKFRMKDKQGEWQYVEMVCSIIEALKDPVTPGGIDIDENTIGQYIGIHDRFGNEIYESDIVYVRSEDENAIIEWDEQTARFIIHFDGWIADFDNYYGKELEIMGDIYNNPELLGGE